jgi:hypothetical protein
MFKVAFALATMVAGASIAQAATLEVGVGKKYTTISAAAAAAAPYDTIIVHPGTYKGATFSDSNLIVRTPVGSVRGSAIVTGATIGDKGLFLTKGSNITIDGFRFTGAKSTARNGAGIRAEGTGLTVRNSEFIGNENGILVTPLAKDVGTVSISNSLFKGNGYGDGQSHGIYVNSVNKLVVANSHFEGTKVGHHLKSRANINEVRYTTFVDTGMSSAASYHIDLSNGGAATIEYNTLTKGLYASNGCCSIALGFEGATNPVGPIVVRNNKLTNLRSTSTTFVTNRTATPATLTSNSFVGLVKSLSGNGSVNGLIN